MRILIVNSGLRYGGAEKQIVGLASELVRRGHAVAIYTLSSEVPRLGELDGSGVEVAIDNKRGKFDAQVLWRLRQFIRTFRADIVHGFLYDGNIYSRVAAWGSGVPVLNSERSDNYELRPSQVWPHRMTRCLADGVVANTHKGREFAQRLFRLPDHRVHMVPNGVHLQDIAACVANRKQNYREMFFAGADVRVACLVGAVAPSKDYLLALDVADCLTRMNDRWRVLFVGEAFQGSSLYRVAEAQSSQQYHRQVQDQYAALALHGRAVFAGQRPDALEIMAQCDVLFSTSSYEGFPNVVLEAMSVGLPVVAVAYSDIRRILPFDWQVTERDPEVLARTILHASEQRVSVGARQLEWVRANATIEQAAAALESVYTLYVQGCH